MELYIFLRTGECINENLWNVFGIIKGRDERSFPGVLLGEFWAYRSVSSHGIIPPQRRPQWGRMWLFHAWKGNVGQGPERLQPPAPPTPNLHTTFQRDYMFLADGSLYFILFFFWLGNKVVTGMCFHLLPWEQGRMKMFHGSAAAFVSVWVWAHSLQMPLSERIQGARTPVYLRKGAPYGGVARVREEPNPRARPPPWKGLGLSFTEERSARLREQIGPEDALPTQLLVLWCIWLRGGAAALISQRIS